MNDKQNTMIVLLLISAAMLGSMLFVAHRTDQSAQAGNTATRSGDYIMSPGSRDSSSDNLYVIDVRERRLLVYMIEPGRTKLNAVDFIDLKKAFK